MAAGRADWTVTAVQTQGCSIAGRETIGKSTNSTATTRNCALVGKGTYEFLRLSFVKLGLLRRRS